MLCIVVVCSGIFGTYIEVVQVLDKNLKCSIVIQVLTKSIEDSKFLIKIQTTFI